MIRNLKALGLALAAVFAFSAMSASAASAANGKLTSDGPVTLDGTEIAGETNSFTAFGTAEHPGETKCPGSTVTGHNYLTPKETEEGKKHGFIEPPAETVTLTPDYNVDECVTIEGTARHFTTVTMNGCDYVLHVAETNGETDTYNTSVDIVCPTGKSIILDVYFSATPTNEGVKVCEVTVGPQTGLEGANVKDETNGHLAVHGTYQNISASKSGLCGSATTNTAKFHANLTVTGTNEEGESTEISLSHS